MGRNIYILGLSGQGPTGFDISGLGHDPAAALIKDGKLVAAAEEERFTRRKHASGQFPYNATKFCLKQAGIALDDVSYIVSNVKFELFNKNQAKKSMFLRPKHLLQFRVGMSVIKKKYLDHIKRLPHFLHEKDSEGRILKRLDYAEHHIAHASSAFHLSGFKNSSILTLDAAGEAATTLIAKGEDEKITKVRETFSPHSIGGFYTVFTEYLGFEPNDGEYKVMGLAPYGKAGINVDNLIWVKDGTVRVDERIFGSYRYYSGFVEREFGPARKKGTKIEKRHADLAYAVQNRLERISEELVRYAVEHTGITKLCLAGGVALNTKMNGRLLELGIIKDIFIQPAAGDAGTAIGAAFSKYCELGYKPDYVMRHAYLGPEYTNDDIKKVLDIAKLTYEYHDDISGIAADLIAKGKIVGWFQGRMEWGPRALGNRSILADPRNPKMKDIINHYVKFREEFRPFCPSLLKKAAPEYLENPYDSPFMILTFRVPQDKIKEIPAVVHVDGTVRPQTVEKDVNPVFYKLIKDFEGETSIPVVLNTSFNIAGEPIVCKPEDAIRTFYACGLDYLAIRNYLVKKR
jgi:carbamoyltransferase